MIISLNWLADHLDLTASGVDELSRLLTFAGVEVEGSSRKGCRPIAWWSPQILSFTQHPMPSAHRLPRRGRAGAAAPNRLWREKLSGGDKVPLALEGAVLPGDHTIKKGRLRGMESQGMMCSGKELGLGDDHEGLLIFPPMRRSGPRWSVPWQRHADRNRSHP